MSDWQPIKTAPKDGSGVLLVDINAESPSAGFGAYLYNVWTAIDPEGCEDDASLIRSMVWVSPTHWMPLPKPPVQP